MNIRTCFRCPQRFSGTPTASNPFKRVRCQKLDEKLAAVQGLGLNSISFNCEIRDSLYTPGDVVSFSLYEKDPEEYTRSIDCTGIVMRRKPRKILVYCEQSDKNPIWIRDDAKKTGETAPVCRHCQKPIGKDIAINGEKWVCRTEYKPYTDESAGEEINLGCEL